MSSTGYALVLLTGVLAVLMMVVLVFALLRFARAARDARHRLREGHTERVFVASAMQEALQKLKAQEQAMSARAHASEHLSEQIVASLTAGLLVVGADGTVQILNPAGRRLLRATERPLPHGYRELLAEAAPVADAIDECMTTGRPILRRALRIERPQRTVHLGVTVSLFGSADVGPHGVICLFQDLTNVVELEEQLRLKVTLARLGELTAGLAHEFRNGLATIHGYGRLIDPTALPAPYGSYVEGIRQETDSLEKVVTNFLSFARPEQVTFHPVDLHDVLQRASEDVMPPGGHRCRLEVQGRFATIAADDVLLRQAFSNLLRNAVEACEGGGVPPHVTVSGSIDASRGLAHVVIEDNGPGIPAGHTEKVFAPFFTTKPQGTGLGLALVQKIVVTHNGRVSIGRSATGGARVHVTLPLHAIEAAPT
ncbi:MAG: two-component system sensor histidine kinase NtrB [Vicinamibacterales bacterium]